MVKDYATDNLKGVFMEKDKLLSHVDKKVKLVLFDGTVLEGILSYDWKNFSIGYFRFKCSYVTKVKEVE